MTNITETKINNVKVKSMIPKTHIDASDVKGGQLLGDPFNVTFLCSKRKSGKTTVVAKIALETTSKKTIFWIFSPNAKTDPTMIAYIDKLKNRGNSVNIFPSLMNGKEDILQTIVDALLEEDEEEEVKVPEKFKRPDERTISINTGTPVVPVKEFKKDGEIEVEKVKKTKYKPKKIAPDYCIIIDDLATQLNKTHGGLANICFNGRHLRMSIYISFQYKNQLPPALWANGTYLFFFKNLSKEKLEDVYKAVDLHGATLSEFLDIYHYATGHAMSDTEKPFLLCDVNNGIYRKNFDKKIEYKTNE